MAVGAGLPHRCGCCRLLERGGGGGVAVQARAQDVVEAGCGDGVDVVGADEAAVRDDTDAAHTEAVLEVVDDTDECCAVGGVAREDVVGEGDAVGGGDETDHDLGPVLAVVAAVAERA